MLTLLVKAYPRNLDCSPRKIHAAKIVVDGVPEGEEHKARRKVIDDLHKQGCFVKSITVMQET